MTSYWVGKSFTGHVEKFPSRCQPGCDSERHRVVGVSETVPMVERVGPVGLIKKLTLKVHLRYILRDNKTEVSMIEAVRFGPDSCFLVSFPK